MPRRLATSFALSRRPEVHSGILMLRSVTVVQLSNLQGFNNIPQVG
jgi:hypothetical protein